MKYKCFGIGLLFFLVIAAHSSAFACVGRKLTIGYKAFTEQAILANLLGIMIEERTGTTVVLREFADTMEIQRALEKNEIQLYIEYTGIGLTEILGEAAEKDPKKVYTAVKKAYKQNFNLIWLKTFGFSSESPNNQEAMKLGLPLEAAPVVRKDTLKKFPALARLINKLEGKIDNQIMGQMVSSVEKDGKAPREVAGRLLNKLGVAFSFVPGIG